jgi:type IV secretory pathway TrbL component
MNFAPVKAVMDPYNKVVDTLSEQISKITQPLDQYVSDLGFNALGSNDLETMQAMSEAVGLPEVAGALGDVAGAMSAAGPMGAIAGEVLASMETGGIDADKKKMGMSAMDQAPATPVRQKSMAELAQDLEKGTDRKSQRSLSLPSASELFQEMMNQLYQDPRSKVRPAY